MRHFLTVILLCFLKGLPLPAWCFDPLELDFEEGFQLNKTKVKGKEQPRLHGADKDFEFTIDPGTQYDVWLDTNHAAAGRRSIAFKIYSDKNENVKDKIELNVIRHDEDKRLTIASDGPRYLSFDFMLDPKYETPTYWVLHAQVWQCCGMHPPFGIFVEPSKNRNSDVQFRFVVRDDQEEKRDPTSKGGKELYRMVITRGAWNSIVLLLDPSFNDDDKEGHLTMWHNGQMKFDYSGDWGYRPDQKSKNDRLMRSDFSLKIGVYRRRQPTVQTIYFDNVRYGTSYESVAK